VNPDQASTNFYAPKFVTELRARVQLNLQSAERIDAQLVSLPRHMSVAQDVFELVELMLTDVIECMAKVHGTLDTTLTELEAPQPVDAQIARTILARADQEVNQRKELLAMAQKMVDGDMDVWGNEIQHNARWDK
jgi:hypothetical protein